MLYEVITISEELEELFEISDRIAVLAAGRLSAPQARELADAESVGLQMAGLFSEGNAAETSHAPA